MRLIKNKENIFLFVIFIIILFNVTILKDGLIAAFSSIFGILYTFFAGKGKVKCYFFGLSGSFLYSYLSYKNAFFGNLFLYLLYYIPMQITGIFKWRSNLKEDKVIIKEKMSLKERIILFFICLIGIPVLVYILNFMNDSNALFDGITTFLSIVGMYLTVRRKIEQWAVWIIVNGFSSLMWLKIILQGEKVYSTLIMWTVYFILAIYFYFDWKKDLNPFKQ